MKIGIVLLVVIIACLAWYAYDQKQRADASALLGLAPPAPASTIAVTPYPYQTALRTAGYAPLSVSLGADPRISNPLGLLT